jgi:hypothetical protein
MKRSEFISSVLLFGIIIISISFTRCKKSEDPVKYPMGTFPDSSLNISDINSVYDDYNMALPEISDNLPVIFSSNRKSSGGQFDLEQGNIGFVFDQQTGAFHLHSEITNDEFLSRLIGKAVTAGNDFGPYRLFSTEDGFEYLILSSVNEAGNLDLFYLKNQPASGSIIPDVTDPKPVKLMITASDDAYFTLNQNEDTAYFTTDKDGNFDIFYLKKPSSDDLTTWFDGNYQTPVRTDSINSPVNDKCPFVLKNIMVFTSDRPGGFGGYDLYYSVMKKGKWSSPVNLGPGINTSSDEYRPVIGYHPNFTNEYIVFSSNRPGGKGGFDLYFRGVDLPLK